MDDSRKPAARAEDPGGRDATLIAAILRIGSSLDLDTVLREVVDGARALTGARYGSISTVDGSGQPLDFVTSGLTPEEHATLAAWPDGPRLFEHLRGLTAPQRLPDLPDYARSIGCAPLPVPCRALLGTPMRHRDTPVGGFFLAEKEGGFTDRDEAVLVLFAQQAAAAIAHARAHRDERRARADLEALVETSPIGVVVLDAATGALLSFNREAKRIVAGLRTPDRPIERLPEAVTCRRGDGRKVTLADLGNAERVRAEEVELSVPDGRSVRTLLDATPIRSAEGAVETVVVTIQDLAPFEALERSRAEFLGLVSHELRAPLAAIKGSAATALGDARDPDRAELRQFLRIVEEQADRMDGLIGDLLDAGRIGAGTLSVDAAPEEVGALVERARTAFAGGDRRHAVVVDLPPDLPRVMADRRRVVQVLDNLLANAARHSPETSPIRVAAGATARTSPFRSPTTAMAWRQRRFPTCSAGTPAPTPGAEGPAWDSSSAKGWWRRTGDASGPRAAGRAGARAWRSRCRWRTRGPALPRAVPRRRGRTGSGHPSSWWTTTPIRCAKYAARSRRRATPRSSPPSRGRCPASSRPEGPVWSCWTWCCPAPTASR